jgi:hypothetical protein
VWIEAVARSWAGAWAAGIQCDDKCFVEIEAVVDSVGSVLVDAVTDAYAFVCGGVSLTHLHLISCHVLSTFDACLYIMLATSFFGESKTIWNLYVVNFSQGMPLVTLVQPMLGH